MNWRIKHIGKNSHMDYVEVGNDTVGFCISAYGSDKWFSSRGPSAK